MRKILTSFFIFTLTFFTLSTTNVSAAKILTSEEGTITVAKGEVINDDLFVGAATAEINGTVNGDVFIGAQTAKVSGIINGNLHIGAQNIMLVGAIVKGSIITGGQTINIDSASVIGGTILAAGQAVSIDSQIKRNVFVGSGMFTLGDNTKIGKDLYYATSPQTSISSKAKIGGSVYKSEEKVSPQPQINQEQTEQFFSAAKFGSTMISFLGSLIIGLILVKLFAKRFAGVVNQIHSSFWKSLGVGFLVIISMVPALIILLITIIGIPLAGIAIIILSLFIALSKIVVGAAIGNWIAAKARWKVTGFWPLALGLLIIYIFKLVPIAGGLFGSVVMLLGLGALIIQTSKAE